MYNFTINELKNYNLNFLKLNLPFSWRKRYAYIDDEDFISFKILDAFGIKYRLRDRRLTTDEKYIIVEVDIAKKNSDIIEDDVFPELEKVLLMKGVDLDSYNSAKGIFRDFVNKELERLSKK